MRGMALRLSKHCRCSVSEEMHRLYAAFVLCSCCGSRQVFKWGQGCWSRPVEKEAQACAKWGRHESWGSGTLLNLQKALPRTQPNQRLSNWICQKKKVEGWWNGGKTQRLKQFRILLFSFSIFSDTHKSRQDGTTACCCVSDSYTNQWSSWQVALGNAHRLDLHEKEKVGSLKLDR